jgi:predicted TIM-barrel fold metal-dependent hydrolase
MVSTDTAEDAVSSLTDLEVVVDADAHVMESLDQFLPYMDEKYSAIKDMVDRTPVPTNSVYQLEVQGPYLPDNYDIGHNAFDEEGGSPYGPDDKLLEMEEFNIDYSIVSPTLNLLLPTVKNDRIAVALANAYNSWLADTVLDAHDSIKATVLAPPQDPSVAAEEIDRLAIEDDIVGVAFPSTGLAPLPGHSYYDPIYQAAEDHNLPVCMHGSAGQLSEQFALVNKWVETYAEGHTIAHPLTVISNVSNMILQGVPERFPNLDMVIQESGIGWVPYLKWRLDDHYLERSFELPLLDQPPSTYFEDHFYVGTQRLGHPPTPQTMAQMVSLVGPESVMFAADLPHFDFDPPEELFNPIRGSLDADAVRRVMGENAMDVFNL